MFHLNTIQNQVEYTLFQTTTLIDISICMLLSDDHQDVHTLIQRSINAIQGLTKADIADTLSS